MTHFPERRWGPGRHTLVRTEIDGSERALALRGTTLSYHSRQLAEIFARVYRVAVRDQGEP